MNSLWDKIIASRLWALTVKETREILRNKHLLFLILVPPILQLLIIGGALDPKVRSLALSTVDRANTTQSRELTARLEASGVFQASKSAGNEDDLAKQLERGRGNVGIVIPQDFSEDLNRGKVAKIQILVDGADAYTAGIASGYLLRTVNEYRTGEGLETKSVPSKHETAPAEKKKELIKPEIKILYNPEQIASWCFVPGVLGACLTLTGTLVASATILREREKGTMEQLLMTPASAWEILLAKIAPIVVFILADVCLAVFAAHQIFKMPVRGDVSVLLMASALYAFVGIGLGMLLGSVCKSQRQAQLASFFINIPLILLSGTVVPLDTMPAFFQTISVFDPLRYYATITRSVILKGVGIDGLFKDMILLAVSAIVVLTISANRFRRQLI